MIRTTLLSAVLTLTAAAASAQDAAPLNDVVLGDPDAPIVIEEYASMTCSHCAAFATETFPEIQERYIDTGQVQFVVKPFPLDPVAAGAFLLARCDADEDFYPRIERLFETQRDWLLAEQPGQALLEVMTEFGFDAEKFDSCLDNPAAMNWIVSTQESAANIVTGTPTFVIDGEIHKGNMPIESFAAILDPLVAENQ